MSKSNKGKKQQNGSAANGEQAKATQPTRKDLLSEDDYRSELTRLQVELVKLMEWVKRQGHKISVVFEGRDGAGKGSTIKRITEHLNPRYCRVVALSAPTTHEKAQWYFQRYVAELPTGGEMVLFDRSWYNRAVVERVMGFCTDDEYREFLRACPEFERMLMRSNIILVKYWFSVSNEEQERRFQARINDPLRRWKLSSMDLAARARWVEVSQAKDKMFHHTDTEESPWYVVDGDDKRRARLNCISHLLSLIPYEDVLPEVEQLPPRQSDETYQRPAKSAQRFIPEIY